MNFASFQSSLSENDPPATLNVHLQSLWCDGKNDWQKAHTIIQEIEDKNAAWIHAYLHRKEGDKGNAGYWYHRAGKSMPNYSLETEWEEIVKTLIAEQR
jgi:hypothetical protein